MSLLAVLSMMMGVLPVDMVGAHSSGYRTSAYTETNNFESYTTGQTNLGTNWSTYDVGSWGVTNAFMEIDSIIAHSGANSLELIATDPSGYGWLTHNFTSPSSSGISDIQLWFYPQSSIYDYIIYPNSFDGGGVADAQCVIEFGYSYSTDPLLPEANLVILGVPFHLDYIRYDAWNALFIEVNADNMTIGVAANQTVMPSVPRYWVGAGYPLAVPLVDSFIVLTSSSAESIYFDDLYYSSTTPDIENYPATTATGGLAYYYNATSTLNPGNSPIVNWTVNTNASWLHFPLVNPNGTKYCNITGVPTDVTATYWVNISCNDTDSFDYQNYSLVVTKFVAPIITSTPYTSARAGYWYTYNAVSTNKSPSSASLNWTVNTNASWLHFPLVNPNGTKYCNITGIPPMTNATYWVNISCNDTDSFDYQNYSLVVHVITLRWITPPLLTAVETLNYASDLDYTSEANWMNLTYSMVTNASWLTINPTTGVISGTTPAGSNGEWFNVYVQLSYTGLNVVLYRNFTICCYDSQYYGAGGAGGLPWNYPYHSALETTDGILLAYNGGVDVDHRTAMYNATNKTWEAPITYSPGPSDWHDQGQIYQCSNGTLIMFLMMSYGGGIQIWRSVNGTSWYHATSSDIVTGLAVEYPVLIKDTMNGTWYLFYMTRDLAPGDILYYNCSISMDEGVTWGVSFPISVANDFGPGGDGYRMYIMDISYDNYSEPGFPKALMVINFAYASVRKYMDFVELNLTDLNFYSDGGLNFGPVIDKTTIEPACRIHSSDLPADFPRIFEVDGRHWVFFTRGDFIGSAWNIWNLSYYTNNGTFSTTYFDIGATSGTSTMLAISNSQEMDLLVLPTDDLLICVAKRGNGMGGTALYGGDIDLWLLNATTLNSTPIAKIMPEYLTFSYGDTVFCSPQFVEGSPIPRIAFCEWWFGAPGADTKIFVWDLNGFIVDGTDLSRGYPLIHNSTPNAVGTIGNVYRFNASAHLPMFGHTNWAVSGASWLNVSFNDTDALISGTPSTAGTYFITLKSSNLGYNDNISWIITVPPQANTTPPAISIFKAFFIYSVNGTIVTFTDKSTGLIATWLWDFGDGATSTQKNPVHSFSMAGEHVISLTIKNGAGATSVCVKIVVTTISVSLWDSFVAFLLANWLYLLLLSAVICIAVWRYRG